MRVRAEGQMRLLKFLDIFCLTLQPSPVLPNQTLSRTWDCLSLVKAESLCVYVLGNKLTPLNYNLWIHSCQPLTRWSKRPECYSGGKSFCTETGARGSTPLPSIYEGQSQRNLWLKSSISLQNNSRIV